MGLVLLVLCNRTTIVIKSETTQKNAFQEKRKGAEWSAQMMTFGSVVLEYVAYYLSFLPDEFTTYMAGIGSFVDSAGAVLGWVMNTLKVCNDLGHRSIYMQFYDACVSPTLKESTTINTLQNRAIQCFLRVHRFGLIPAVLGNMGRMVCTTKI